jgi:hypothetical protein
MTDLFSDLPKHFYTCDESVIFKSLEALGKVGSTAGNQTLLAHRIGKALMPESKSYLSVEIPMNGAWGANIEDDIGIDAPESMGVALVTVLRGDHSTFLKASTPTKAIVEMLTLNGGRGAAEVDLTKGVEYAVDALESIFKTVANAAGPVTGKNTAATLATNLAQMAQMSAQHLAKNHAPAQPFEVV